MPAATPAAADPIAGRLSAPPELPRGAIIDPRYGFASLTDEILSLPLRPRFPRWWLLAMGASAALTLTGFASALWLLYWGPGVWGINIPVAWGFAILNFVWWIGIGHAGTLISAILLLLRQEWRTSINRIAETMTLFAVMNAGIFPLLHLGRYWKFYYLLPYPDTMGLWPQWRSPLVWDVIAVMTYGTVSLLFWYLGMLPDLAAMRDAAHRRWVKRLAGIFALGWRGAAKHWQNQQSAYLLLAGLATPLVVSVHSIVALDFAIGIVPGWHTTVFPPYFVAGAIFSGFSMVLTLIIPGRVLFGWQGFITQRHLEVMAKVMLTSGLIVAYGYLMENFNAFFSGDEFEIDMAIDRATGAYAPMYWATLTCNVLIPQLLWLRPFRARPVLLFFIALAINVGMWTERYTIVIQPLHRDYMPSAWGWFTATFCDWTLFLGTLGLFALALLALVRILPLISMSELRELLHHKGISDGSAPAAARHTKIAAPETQLSFSESGNYGLMAEYDRPEALVRAAAEAHRRGYRRLDAFSPLPIPELKEALKLKRSRIPLLVLIGGFGGAASMFALQCFAVFEYVWNIGGRPIFSWPSFVPLTFEVGVLGGALAAFVGTLILNRFPQPYHPVFNLPAFARASRDRFFLLIEQRDALYSPDQTEAFLRETTPSAIHPVPAASEEERE